MPTPPITLDLSRTIRLDPAANGGWTITQPGRRQGDSPNTVWIAAFSTSDDMLTAIGDAVRAAERRAAE